MLIISTAYRKAVLIIKKTLSALAMLGLMLALCPAAAAEPSLSAQSAVVMTESGQLLYEKNGDERALIASTTKLMTAIVSIENAGLDEVVDIKPECCHIEGSSMYLDPEVQYTVRDLLLGLLLVSGNDAAEALACHVAGDSENFVRLMNAKAAELGMENSSFMNPHGLDAEGHYSTALDMAKLMCYCMQNQTFCQICGTKSCVINGLTLVNHNKLLDICPGCIGGKTGYTMAAGRCLVSCCEREGLRLVCVTLSAPDDWNDHLALYDWAYGKYGLRDVMAGLCFPVPVISGEGAEVSLVPAESMILFLPKSQEVTLRVELPQFVFAPVNKGETGGQIWVIINGELVGSCELIYERDVQPASSAGFSYKQQVKL